MGFGLMSRTLDRMYDEGFVYDVYPNTDGKWELWYHGGPGDSASLTTLPALENVIRFTLWVFSPGGLRLHLPKPKEV